MAGNGWCTHPKRQLSSDVRILVRPAELACRNSWGNDYWEDKDTVGEPTPVKPINVPKEQPPSEPSHAQASFEDQVTSVVNSESHRSHNGGDLNDRVVEHSIRSDDDLYPDHSEQNERIDLLARDSRNAIERARQRHRLRRNLDATPDDDPQITADATQTKPDFQPDDFVEEETPSGMDETSDSEQPSDDEDVILSENFGVRSPRSRRLRRTREKNSRPKRDPLPDPDTADATTPEDVHSKPVAEAPVERDRFNSVPEISADFDLPRARREVQANQDIEPVSQEAAAPQTPKNENAYDVAAKRAEAIKAAARAERRERTSHDRRPLAPLRVEKEKPAPSRQRAVTERQAPLAREERSNAPVQTNPRGEEPWNAAPLTSRPEQPKHERPELTHERPRIEQRSHFIESDGDTTDLVSATYADNDGEPEYINTQQEPYPEYAEDEYLASRGIRARRRPEVKKPSIAPDAKRNWWRGIFQSRPEAEAPRQVQSLQESSVELDSQEWMEEPEEATTVYTATYHSDRRDADDVVWADLDDTEDEPWLEAGNEAALDHPVPEDDVRYAFDEEEDHSPGAWQRDVARPEYAPLDLADEREMDAFRNRLFSSTSVERGRDTARVERGPEQSAPITMRGQRPFPVDSSAKHVRPLKPETLLEAPSDAYYEPEISPGFDIRDLVARESELLDMTIEVSPEIPRNCATCRSYRGSEQGGRGWCTNTWAFTHRQMVNAEDLACQSTIGCWWLPADHEVWLEDIDTDQPATPRIDRLIAHLDPLRRAVGR